jgi:hypothetical protein
MIIIGRKKYFIVLPVIANPTLLDHFTHWLEEVANFMSPFYH